MTGIRRHAWIDLAAFAENIAALDGPLDFRADAYGHAIRLVGPVARDVGIAGVVVSDEADAAAARDVGLTDVRIDRTAALGPPDRIYGFAADTRPVMTVVGEVIARKHAGAGAGVSYGYSHRTAVPTDLLLIGLGYADGIPRLASNRARIFVNGGQHPLVGRVAMDQFMVDVGDADAAPGDLVVLFGDPARGEPPVTAWGAWTERRPAAVTAGLGVRLIRAAR